jgi:hypothetical protein
MIVAYLCNSEALLGHSTKRAFLVHCLSIHIMIQTHPFSRLGWANPPERQTSLFECCFYVWVLTYWAFRLIGLQSRTNFWCFWFPRNPNMAICSWPGRASSLSKRRCARRRSRIQSCMVRYLPTFASLRLNPLWKTPSIAQSISFTNPELTRVYLTAEIQPKLFYAVAFGDVNPMPRSPLKTWHLHFQWMLHLTLGWTCWRSTRFAIIRNRSPTTIH